MENYIIDLIQAEIDGENSTADSRRVQEILRTNEQARSLFNDLKKMEEKMDNLKQEMMLPEGLSSSIKNEIEARRNREFPQSNIHNMKTKEKTPGSKMFLGRTAAILAAAAAVVIVVFVTTDFQQPEPHEVSGTVGTDEAERIEPSIETQLADADLDGDEILQILQSDYFRQLVEAGNLQAITTNETFSHLLSNPHFNELFTNPDFYTLMKNPAFNELITNPDFKLLISNPAFNQLMAHSEFNKFLTNPDFHQLIANPTFN